MKISISSPFPVDSQQGNSVSAKRIGGLLENAGHSVELFHDGFGPDTELFIALNAWRSAEIIGKFSLVRDRDSEDSRKMIVIMTGSDLFPFDGTLKRETLHSIKLANAIVITHGEAREKIDHPLICEIRKSLVLPGEINRLESVKTEATSFSQGMLVAHLREQKNPFLYLRSIPYLKLPVRILHYGNAISEEFRESAEKYQSEAYQWMGEVPRIDLLRALQKTDFLLNTSYIEGSSNAIYESIALGIPVIAAAIPGNRGVLGKDYQGLFRPDDAESLAALLDRFSGSEGFRKELKQQGDQLRRDFQSSREQEEWCDLFSKVCEDCK